MHGLPSCAGPTSNPFLLKVDVTSGQSGAVLFTQCHQGPADAGAPGEAQTPLARVTSRSSDTTQSREPWADAALARHIFHADDSAGSRCVNCHMSDPNWRLLTRRRDHTFQPLARVIGASPMQSQTTTERPRAAAVVTGARDGRVEPKVLGALLGAASDPEPMVRAATVRALGTLDQRDERVVAVLMARLVDEARVVRARAAESLLALDVATAPGRAGEALARRNSNWLRACGRFRNRRPQQAALAWLHAERGEAEASARAVDAALAVDPALARPYVIRGVLAARAGRFSDALASWRAARERDPRTPNIDRMIDEATRRATPPR